jgi:hypothetical protein
MALIDPRLLPLLEVLTTSGVDWLVFELMDGIRAGNVTEEPEVALAKARNDVFNSSDARPIEFKSLEESVVAAVPIEGDEQIAWATEYISKRIEDTILMLRAGLQGLEAIASAGSGPRGSARRIGKPLELTLVLQDGDMTEKVQRASADNAIEAFKSLQEALAEWAKSTKGMTPRA